MNKRNIIAVAIVAAFISTGAQAADPTVKCTAGKLKEAGKLSFCFLKADAKSVLKDIAADYTKCDEKFAAKWDKIEAKAGPGICVVEGESIDVQTVAAQAATDTYGIVNPPPSKLVFVTDGRYAGDLGGVVGANAKCQTSADNAGLGGTYKAWLGTSSPESSPNHVNGEWIHHNSGPYRRVDGPVVADNWDDLTDGQLSLAINYSENGRVVPSGGGYSWTNVSSAGSALGNTDCDNWTSNDGTNYGWAGRVQGPPWTDYISISCSALLHLYCFEQ